LRHSHRAATIEPVPEAMGIYRGEVLTIMGALADIQTGLREIRGLLEDDDGTEEEEGDDEP
jgi:hypothetical protein